MRKIVLIAFGLILCNALFAQNSNLEKLTADSQKGDYAILEVRMNNEDEFRTVEGSKSGLARLAVFMGNNKGEEVLAKDFEGFNSVVQMLNQFESLKWRIVDTYSFSGSSLIVTHYVLRKK